MSKPAPRPKKVDPAYLERAALHYLERYASSSTNLRRVLMRKVQKRSFGSEDGAPPDAMAWIDALVEKLIRLRLLDDAAYAEGRTRRLYAEGKSLGRIRQTLAAKGIKAEAAEAALDNLREESVAPVSDLPAAIAYARRRKLGPYRTAMVEDDETRRALRQKDMAALARRGFASDVVRRIINAASIADVESLSDD